VKGGVVRDDNSFLSALRLDRRAHGGAGAYTSDI
jgi:hypothetical protein